MECSRLCHFGSGTKRTDTGNAVCGSGACQTVSLATENGPGGLGSGMGLVVATVHDDRTVPARRATTRGTARRSPTAFSSATATYHAATSITNHGRRILVSGVFQYYTTPCFRRTNIGRCDETNANADEALHSGMLWLHSSPIPIHVSLSYNQIL